MFVLSKYYRIFNTNFEHLRKNVHLIIIIISPLRHTLLSAFVRCVTASPIVFLSNNETYVKKFSINGTKTTFQFTNPPPGTNEIDWLRRGLAVIVNNMKGQGDENYQLGFELHH